MQHHNSVDRLVLRSAFLSVGGKRTAKTTGEFFPTQVKEDSHSNNKRQILRKSLTSVLLKDTSPRGKKIEYKTQNSASEERDFLNQQRNKESGMFGQRHDKQKYRNLAHQEFQYLSEE